MADEKKTEIIDGLNRAFEEFKVEHKKGRDADAGVLARIDADIQRFDKANQDFIKAREVEAKAAADRIAELEKKLNRKDVGAAGAVDAREAKAIERKQAFEAFTRYGVPGSVLGAEEGWNRISEEKGIKLEKKALIASDDTAGGYLAPPEYVREIIKAIVLVSPVRDLARVRQTGQRSVQLPKRTQTAAAVWVSEGAARVESQNPAYGLTECPTHELTAEVYVSFQDLEDSVFDLEGELRNEFAEQFAVSEGAAVVAGNGAGKPFGFTDAGQGVGFTGTGTSGSIVSSTGAKGDALITLCHSVKSGYAKNARWALARQTLGSVRKLTDAQGRYLWEPSMAPGAPSTILGYPYTEVPDMPLEAANSFSVGFGDWMRAYTIVDRIALSVMRDPFTKASAGQVKFMARRRVGGQVVLAEAIKLLKCI